MNSALNEKATREKRGGQYLLFSMAGAQAEPTWNLRAFAHFSGV